MTLLLAALAAWLAFGLGFVVGSLWHSRPRHVR
jgi:hypothetical protein